MSNQKDLEKILEDIKDIFYSEVEAKMISESLDIYPEIEEGKFFSKLEDYLKLLLLSDQEQEKITKKSVSIDHLMIKRSINYRQSLSFVRNRGYGWELPTIDDFFNLSLVQKSLFHDDIFWSSTSYDDQSVYCYSFKRNSKIIMNKSLYFNLALKRII